MLKRSKESSRVRHFSARLIYQLSPPGLISSTLIWQLTLRGTTWRSRRHTIILPSWWTTCICAIRKALLRLFVIIPTFSFRKATRMCLWLAGAVQELQTSTITVFGRARKCCRAMIFETGTGVAKRSCHRWWRFVQIQLMPSRRVLRADTYAGKTSRNSIVTTSSQKNYACIRMTLR